MKPLFVQFRAEPAGQSFNQEAGLPDDPPQQDAPLHGADGSPTPDRLRGEDSSDRAPYAIRLRMIFFLGLLSWAMIALATWAIQRL